MNEGTIVSWEEDRTTELYVPEYVHEMAHQVLKKYNFSVKSIEVVATKPTKGAAIWRVETNKGPKSLKLLQRRPTRSLFSIGAQEYLVKVQKARVPPIIKTKKGNNYVELGGKLWFVAEWIVPLYKANKDLEGAKQLSFALGEFHRLSKGYIPPKEAEVSTRLNKWPRYYTKVIEKMGWFRNIAEVYRELPASPYLLKSIDRFEEQAKTGLEMLNQSSYYELVEKGNEYWGLVHQDYGWSNGQIGSEGIWIIDLDGVRYDLPIRDLRKLISGAMESLQRWDKTWVREMIQAYHEANPISAPLYEILMIDLSMPNEFYKNIKQVVYDPELFLTEETASIIQDTVESDQTKWFVLDNIRNDWEGKK